MSRVNAVSRGRERRKCINTTRPPAASSIRSNPKFIAVGRHGGSQPEPLALTSSRLPWPPLDCASRGARGLEQWRKQQLQGCTESPPSRSRFLGLQRQIQGSSSRIAGTARTRTPWLRLGVGTELSFRRHCTFFPEKTAFFILSRRRPSARGEDPWPSAERSGLGGPVHAEQGVE